MTAAFALLAALGAAGLAFSLLGAKKAPAPERSFTEELKAADGPGQDLARRLELLEDELPRQRAAFSGMARRLELLEEKLERLAAARGPAAGGDDRVFLAAAVRSLPELYSGLREPEKAGGSGAEPARGESLFPEAALSRAQGQRRAPRRPRKEGAAQPGRRPSALSKRMTAVWNAAEKNADPLEIARALNIGVSEVELALKVRNMRPEPA